MTPMNDSDFGRLTKLVALFDSAYEGERANALDAAGALLGRYGKSMVDLPRILAAGPTGDGLDFDQAADSSDTEQAEDTSDTDARSVDFDILMAALQVESLCKIRMIQLAMLGNLTKRQHESNVMTATAAISMLATLAAEGFTVNRDWTVQQMLRGQKGLSHG